MKRVYKITKSNKTTLRVNKSYQGETIEAKVRRIVNNKEPITDGAPLIYTDRKDGVQPAYNIRTDRFDIAVDAMDVVNKTHQAKREAKLNPPQNQDKIEPKKGGNNGGAESLQGTT